MSFFKTNAHWLTLATTAAASVTATVFLLKDLKDFPEKLQQMQPRQVTPKRPAPLNLLGIDTATRLVGSPSQWGSERTSLLFVSEPYLWDPEGLKRPKEGSVFKHSKTGQPIPNSWFLEHKLALGTPKISTADTDGDGFTNEEEWLAGTDPNDPKSRPPLITKLGFVKEQIIHNRISFLQYLGDPSKPASLKVTIRREDSPKRPQSELKIGQVIEGTEIKVTNFTPRRKDDSGIKDAMDGSLLTLVDSKTSEEAEAEVKGRPADFVDKTISLRFSYPKETRELSLKLGESFVLGDSETYTVVDSSPTGVTVRNSEGKLFQIHPSQAD